MSSEEKSFYPLSGADRASTTTKRKLSKFRCAVVAGLTCFLLASARHWVPISELARCKHIFTFGRQGPDQHFCPQADVLIPAENRAIWEGLKDSYKTDEFRLRAVDWLAGAVKIPTESYDAMDSVGVDPRWKIFGELHEYLKVAFPLVHSKLILTKHNTYGLLYEWKGSDSSLKPLLIMAHQDVVPVDPKTVNEWTHPPYSGYYDGSNLWGRGSNDDKSGLIASLSAVETLLESRFQPMRTVLLSYGFDEEASGPEGARILAKDLLEQWGENSIGMIIDEGAPGGFSEQHGSVFAHPGVAEKGYFDVRVEVTTAGGHSSVPPSHTSIGILSKLLVEIEDHPYNAQLSRDDILYSTLQCYAEHAKSFPSDLRKVIRHSANSDKALRELQHIINQDPQYVNLIATTQAIDLIQGGVKSNALPEQAWAVVNHRISTRSSLEETQAHNIKVLKKFAKLFNLTFTAFGQHITDPDTPSKGKLTLSDAFHDGLEPAPITSTSGDNTAPYQLLSGTIKATYNAHRNLEGDNIAIGPGLPTGNTDTRHYWKLSDHIFRYNHRNNEGGILSRGIHTVNENIGVDSFLEIITFFTTLVLNADESRSI
ncbi:carboxypeptidase S [Marasmius fiardii PR-910]|nr:carboxypeptidase S [Marasmius fiardii PR-910]